MKWTVWQKKNETHWMCVNEARQAQTIIYQAQIKRQYTSFMSECMHLCGYYTLYNNQIHLIVRQQCGKQKKIAMSCARWSLSHESHNQTTHVRQVHTSDEILRKGVSHLENVPRFNQNGTHFLLAIIFALDKVINYTIFVSIVIVNSDQSSTFLHTFIFVILSVSLWCLMFI